MAGNPRLLRRRDRRGFRRSVFLCALAGMLLLAPGAGGVPAIRSVDHAVTIRGTLGLNGWYRSNVTVNWQVDDPESIDPDRGLRYARRSPSTRPGEPVTCWARSDGGETSAVRRTIKIDKTAPAVSDGARAPSRCERLVQPSAHGRASPELTRPLGSRAARRPIRGPGQRQLPSLLGRAPTSPAIRPARLVPFKYDATPPSIFGTTATHGNRSAQISWRKSSDTKLVEVFRTPGRNGQGESGIYRGTANGVKDTGLVVGRKYEYRVVGVDEAANRAEQKLSLVATGALLSPTPGLRITMKSPPTLVWARAKGASYYNVQLIRAGRKVLSAWPARTSFRLRRTWLYKGQRYRLQPGVYRWYVWPGYGRISAARYAPRPLGSSSFVVTK